MFIAFAVEKTETIATTNNWVTLKKTEMETEEKHTTLSVET